MALAAGVSTSLSGAPRHVYLTWQGDTATTMTVNFHTLDPTAGAGGAGAADVVVPFGAQWRFFDGVAAVSTGWRALGFNDSSWGRGVAELGYGDGDEGTVISYGPDKSNKALVAYFRHTFELEDVEGLEEVRISFRRDDGAALYLNGVEIARSNLRAEGAIGPKTRALKSGEDDDVKTVSAPGSLLREGRNVIAASVHQYRPTSSDLSFDLKLEVPGLAALRRKKEQAAGGVVAAEPCVYFDTAPKGGIAAAYAHRARGTQHTIPGLRGRLIHWVELTGLDPAKTYYFVAGDARGGFSEERAFRTVPRDGSTVRFVSKKDMGVSKEVGQLLGQAARLRPQFALIGGDIAYANGALKSTGLWDQWLDHWGQQMVTPEGLTIPVVLAIGNHEVDGGFGKTGAEAPFFFNYFAQAGTSSFFSRTFGPHLAVFALDTGHATSHKGAQAAWLERELQRHAGSTYRVAVYHVPLYPSHRDFGGRASADGRKYWGPLFDRYRLDYAFENHDHTHKRTPPLRGGAKAGPGGGTVYFGDGCWGRAPRSVDRSRWYLEKALSARHFWLVDVGAVGLEARAIDIAGRVFDVYPKGAAGEAAARTVFEELRRQEGRGDD